MFRGILIDATQVHKNHSTGKVFLSFGKNAFSYFAFSVECLTCVAQVEIAFFGARF